MKKKQIKSNTDRRGFMKKTGISLGSLFVLQSHVLFGKKEVKDVTGKVIQKAVTLPNDKINLACCGIGNRGASVIRDLHATGAANVISLCDVNLGAEKTIKSMQMHPSASQHKDFRKMFVILNLVSYASCQKCDLFCLDFDFIMDEVDYSHTGAKPLSAYLFTNNKTRASYFGHVLI